MKGKKWYKDPEIAEEYDPKRFSGEGGHHIDQTEKTCVKKALGKINQQKILEIATGTGRFSLMLAQEGADVTACDISSPMLEIAQTKADKKGLSNTINFFKGDAEQLPFKDNTFDKVMAIRFMHLVDDPEKFLKEMTRVTKKTVIFDTFNLQSFRILYNKILPMDSRLYSEEEVQKLAEKNGLKIEDKIENFVIPFAIYRYTPDILADTLKELDYTILNKQTGKKLSSVTYWKLKKQN
ncbi:class I SAM-dependent methyltransferase [Methanonatronarchaeum sp. AMET6-2]|uniref:class I SAM-dependent methyltransferase n=1 Tax=Methanonatronarchaeum sp. AMET6-2 TaxID=2933293 RepID=UPI00122294CE|nr:class I SAM-dependent methyltransferase [Methanonatronarchaeum sp. AMET6-2]RZN61791.1 MAG: class I SAM-dependent methyltransferase [Methanonatronarchaeia archaeon]UOY10216.1 methyltransferase domain-containing protein [Methanonatronarchaeum sp. AMET6-2]